MGVENLNSELIKAVDSGDVVTVRTLLSRGADPNTKELLSRTSALALAAGGGDLNTVKLLVEAGAAVNAITGDVPTTALEVAAVAGRLDVVQWLLNHGATIEAGPELDSLLADLVEHNQVPIASLLKNKALGCQI